MESRRSSQASNAADRRRTSQARGGGVAVDVAVEPPQRISIVIPPTSTDAFTVLPPTKPPPPPPSAPTPYRVAAPRKKKTSFVILAENAGNGSSPQGSRSPSPSGRVSPFRGRGFKPSSQPPSRDPSPPPPPKKASNATYNAKKASVVKGVQPSRIPISPSNSPKRVAPTHGRRASVSPGRPPMSPQRTPAAKTSVSSPRRTSSIGQQPNPPTSPRRVSHHSAYTPTPSKPRPAPTSPRRRPSYTSPQPSAPTSPRHAAVQPPSKGPASPKRVSTHQSRPPGRSPMLKRQNNMNPLPPPRKVQPEEIIMDSVPPSRSQSPTTVTSPSRIPVHQRKRGISPGGLYPPGTPQGPVGKPPIAPKTPKPNPRILKTKAPEKTEYVPSALEEQIKVTIETPVVEPKRLRPRLPLNIIAYALPTMASSSPPTPKPAPTPTTTSIPPNATTVTSTASAITPPTPTRPTRVSVEDVATSLMERAASVNSLTTTLPGSLTSSLSTAVAATRLVASVPPKTEKLNEMVAQSTSMTLLVSPPPPPPSVATPCVEVRETRSVARDASSHSLTSASKASVSSNSVVGVIRAEVTEAAEMLLASEAELPEEEATSEIIRPNVQSATAVGRGVAQHAKTPSLESITSAAGASGAATTISMSSVRTTSAKTVRDPSPVITSPQRLIREEAEMESLSANNLQRQAWNDRQPTQPVPASNGVHQPAPAPVAASPKTGGCCPTNGVCSRLCQRLGCCRTTPKCCDKLNCCKGVSVKTPACCSRIAGWFRRLSCSKLNCCAKCKSANCCKGLGSKLNCCKSADCCKKKPTTDSNGNKLHCCKKLDCCPSLSSCCRRKKRDGRDAEEGKAGYCCSGKGCFPRCCSRKTNAPSDIESASEETPGCWAKFKNCCCKKGAGCCAKKKPGEKGTTGCFGCCGGKKGAAGGDPGGGCFGRCCRKKVPGAKAGDTPGCFANCCKKKAPGAAAGAPSKGCCGGKGLCGAFKACFATMFCLNAACCRVRKDSQEGVTMEAIRKRSNATRMSKKKSIDPERLKLDLTMVDTVSIIRASIPVLPVFLAWTCLVFNVFLPGTGTVLSGFLCLCLGRARFSQHDDIQGRIQALILDIIVGVGQAFTIMFCLVGWGWSIWWGVIMVKLARKYQKMQKVDPNAPETLPAPGAAGARNHVDIERGRH